VSIYKQPIYKQHTPHIQRSAVQQAIAPQTAPFRLQRHSQLGATPAAALTSNAIVGGWGKELAGGARCKERIGAAPHVNLQLGGVAVRWAPVRQRKQDTVHWHINSWSR
jgi:hypothetical protein